MADNANSKELLVVTFSSPEKAGEVLKVLQQLSHEHIVQLKDAATIVCDAEGKVSIKETKDFDSKQGAIVGAVAGGLLGALASRVAPVENEGQKLGLGGFGTLASSGALGALAGAGAGFLADKAIDLGFDDKYLQQIATELTPGTSALLAIVSFEKVDAAIQALEPYEGKIIQQSLPADVAAKLDVAFQ
jgi:uncharacterized membrane protein